MRIDSVIVTEQNGTKVYTFPLTAVELLEIGIVERFGVDPNGVNRLLNEKHVTDIAEAMSEKKGMWLEPIIGDLQGDWKVARDESFVEAKAGAKLSIDDGQHRFMALKSGLLTREEIEKVTFMVTGTIGLPYEKRLEVFRMQAERRMIDPRLDLAMRSRLNDWRNDIDREAYRITTELNGNPNSPLRGKIQLDEGNVRPRENGGGRAEGINARGIYATVRTLLGRKSPLHNLTPPRQTEIIMDTIRIAAKVWKTEWNSNKHILTTARGINALLMLFIAGVNFRSVIGEDFSAASLEKGFNHAKTFDWSSGKATNQSVRQIVERLDQSILRAIQRRRETGDDVRQQSKAANA